MTIAQAISQDAFWYGFIFGALWVFCMMCLRVILFPGERE